MKHAARRRKNGLRLFTSSTVLSFLVSATVSSVVTFGGYSFAADVLRSSSGSSSNNQQSSEESSESRSTSSRSEEGQSEEEEQSSESNEESQESSERRKEAPQNSSDPSLEMLRPSGNLGCFTGDGRWTMDRKECDSNQGRHIYGETSPVIDIPVQSSPEAPGGPTAEQIKIRREFHEVMRKKFDVVRDPMLEQKRVELLDLIQNSLERVSLVVETQELSEDARNFVNESLDRLLATFAAATSMDQSREEMRLAAYDVRVTLGDVQNRLRDEIAARAEQVNEEESWQRMENIAARTDNLLSKMPEVFSILTRNDVDLPAEAYVIFNDTNSLWNEVRPACAERNRDGCNRIVDVINGLQMLKVPMQESIDAAGKPQLMDEITSLLSAQ